MPYASTLMSPSPQTIDRRDAQRVGDRGREKKVEWENSIWVLKQMSVHTVAKSQVKTQKKPREHFKINSGKKKPTVPNVHTGLVPKP